MELSQAKADVGLAKEFFLLFPQKKETMMNFLNKKALVALALVGFGGSAFGTDWYIYNKTTKPMMIRMSLLGDSQIYDYLVEPNGLAKFEWPTNRCYETITVGEYNKVDAAKVNPKLANLPYGAYGSSSTPSGCVASARDVQSYFESQGKYVISILYPDVSTYNKITSDMKNGTLELSPQYQDDKRRHCESVTLELYGFKKSQSPTGYILVKKP